MKGYFDHDLLSRCELLHPDEVRRDLGDKIERKYGNSSKKMRQYHLLMAFYEAFYEWEEATKAYAKKKKEEAGERPPIPIGAIYPIKGGLAKRIRSLFRLYAM